MKEKQETTQVTTKERIVEVAQELFFTQGFGATPVEQIIRTLDIAKGTFYHHFTGKDALLDEIIERYTQDVFAAIRPVVEDGKLSAPEKLTAFLKRGFARKMEDTRTVELTRIFYAPGNALLREKLSAMSINFAVATLTPIIRQGVAEGVYRTPVPDRVAGLVWRIATSLSQDMAQMMLRENGGVRDLAKDISESEALISDMEYTIERLLDAPVGSVSVLDRDEMRQTLDLLVAAAPATARVATKKGAQL